MNQQKLIDVKGVSKSFPGVRALSNIDFSLSGGEIVALLGGNGAGKSTLIKCMTGVYQPDAGDIAFDGRVLPQLTPEKVQQLGVSTVHQEVNLIPSLSVAENIYLCRQPRRRGRIDWARMNADATQLLSEMGISIDVTRNLADYSIAIQQMVAIARGVDMSAKVLILDEPTASLDSREVEQLFDLMRRLKASGIGLVFVTHFLDQVYQVSDRIVVLRNGKSVGSYATAELSKLDLISQMLGKSLSPEAVETSVHKPSDMPHKSVLRTEALGRSGSIEPFSLDIRKGEVLGLAGLLGSGRTEAANLIFGIDNADSGVMHLGDKVVQKTTPNESLRNGLGFCPEDRKVQGVIGELSVKENIILALQSKRGWFRMLSQKQQRDLAVTYIKSLNIVTSDIDKPVRDLSGGNQQKVILARWLAAEPELLILDEPTRGIDVGARAEIDEIIRNLCKQGMAILVIASELDEVVSLSDRIAVLKDRKVIAELSGAQMSENDIMKQIAETEV